MNGFKHFADKIIIELNKNNRDNLKTFEKK